MGNYLEYKPLSKSFYIADTALRCCAVNSETPVLEMALKHYQQIGCDVPKDNAPIVGILLGRFYDGYSISQNLVYAVAKPGAKIRFLTYMHCEEQLQECDAVVLPDGIFALPDAYFTDTKAKDVQHQSDQSAAYAECINYALMHNMPILGISNGALMVAGYLGFKMYRSYNFVETPIRHKTLQEKAHLIQVFSNTPLALIWKGDTQFHVNSRHGMLLAPVRVQRKILAQAQNLKPDEVVLPLDIYAEANDGVPEAWGSDAQHIMCVQWHPEDMASKGHVQMQSIFKWLVDEVAKYRKR